jgi:hypothetical protein
VWPTDEVSPRPPYGRPADRCGHTSGFRIVATALTWLTAFGTVPTPLWPLYQLRDHFGATTVTIVYALMGWAPLLASSVSVTCPTGLAGAASSSPRSR